MRLSFSLIFLLLVLARCGTSANNGPKISIAAKSTSAAGITKRDYPILSEILFQEVRALTAGQSAATGLSSLQYYIRSIEICENLTVNGTAFSNPQNCLTLFDKGPNGGYEYTPGNDYSQLATSARSDTTNFIDLMSSSRSNLNTAVYLQRSHVRSYNWGVINWYPPVKFKASVPVNDVVGSTTTTYKTHDGTTTFVNSNFFRTTTTANFTSGVAEDAVVLLTNGGSWFKFQSPLPITNADIDSGTQFVLDLAFNPEGLVKAYATGVSSRSNVLRDASANEMNIPYLEMAPIPHKSNQTATREAYVFDSTTASPAVSDNFNLRFDLYYITGESTKTIYAVEAKTLYRMVGIQSGSFTITDVMDFPKISYVTENPDGTLNFKIYDESVVIQDFSRKTSNGASGNATIKCSSTGWSFNGCAAGSSITMQYTLQSQDTI